MAKLQKRRGRGQDIFTMSIHFHSPGHALAFLNILFMRFIALLQFKEISISTIGHLSNLVTRLVAIYFPAFINYKFNRIMTYEKRFYRTFRNCFSFSQSLRLSSSSVFWRPWKYRRNSQVAPLCDSPIEVMPLEALAQRRSCSSFAWFWCTVASWINCSIWESRLVSWKKYHSFKGAR